MKLFSPDNSELMNISELERDGDVLVVKGTAFGAMPIVAHLRPDEARAALKLLNLKLVLFLLKMVLWPARPPKES